MWWIRLVDGEWCWVSEYPRRGHITRAVYYLRNGGMETHYPTAEDFFYTHEPVLWTRSI